MLKRAEKKENVKQPLSVDKGYTIFDALFESLKKQNEKDAMSPGLLQQLYAPTALATLFLMALGLVTLAWVGNLVWQDITVWGKDTALIFFGSRAGEAISLGIGMTVIHYLIMGLALILSSVGLLIIKRRT